MQGDRDPLASAVLERLNGDGPLHLRLTRALAAALDRGVVIERLPAERELATAIGVSRTTVLLAYDELVADGRVERRRGSGTYVTREQAMRRQTFAHPPVCEDPLECVLEFFRSGSRTALSG